MKKDSTNCPKKTREKSKTRAWEKERRDRISECFNNLRKVLPNYDASRTLSKIDILNGATSTIKDLDEKLKNVLTAPKDQKNEEQKLKISADLIKKLQNRVRKLLVRNEELVNLLKNAGISVPSAFGTVKKIKSAYAFSNKLTPGQAKLLQKELEKENQVKPPKPSNPKKPKRNIELKFKKGASNSKSNKFLKRQVMNMMSSPNCLFIVSQPRLINNSCYILPKNPRRINQTVISHSPFVTTPIVSSNIKPPLPSTHRSLSDLGPGTLLFANGTVMPIVSTPVQSNLPTFIVVSCNAKTLCTNKISVSTDTKATLKGSINPLGTVSKTSVKDSVCSLLTRPVLKPKSCITKTTQINKVPIPALSSKYNRHSCLESLEPSNKDKKDKLDNSNNKPEKGKISVFNKKSNRKIIQEQIKNDAKRPKTDTEENEKNVENLASTADPRATDQSSVSKIEVTVPSTKCQQLVSGVIEDIIIDKRQGAKIETTTASKVQTITVKPLDDLMSSISNQEPYQAPESRTLENKTSKEVPKANETLNYISTEYKEPLNTKSVENIIENQVQLKMCSKTKTNCEPLTTTTAEMILSNNTPVTTSANKKEIKAFEINVSHSDSITKNNNANDLKSLEINLPQSELSNDIFASFQVPPGCQNPGSTSPTAAFLMAFPLVSSGTKVTEVIGDENSESHAGTPNLLQIGTMDISKPTQSYSDSLTPSLLSFENFSFFSNRDNCGGFYNNCHIATTTCQTSTVGAVSSAKVTTSYNSNTTVPPPDITDTENKNNRLKLNTNHNLKLSSNNQTDSTHNKSLTNNNFKTDVSGRVPTNSKSSSISTHQETLQSSKGKAQLYNSYSFDRNSELGTTNIVDINTNPYSSKLVTNDNYSNKTKSSMSGQVYISKTSDSCTNYGNYRDCTSFVTNSVVLNKNYNPMYTSAGNNNYFYNSSGSVGDTSNFNLPNCNNYSEYKKSENFSHNYNGSPQVYHKDKFNQNVQPKIKPSATQNKPINWMTSPSTTVSYKPDYFLPSFPKEHNFNANLSTNMSFNTLPSNTYFNTPSVYNSTDHLNSTSDIKKVDLSLPSYSSYQRTEAEENQFSWSPNKMPQFLDPAHSHTFVSSTLPTLVGDLALNNTPNLEQKQTKDKNRDNRRKVGHCENQNGQTNFLSVSQLVENNPEHVPAKVISRRSSGNRSKTNSTKAKRVISRSEANKDISLYQKNDKVNQQKHFDNIAVSTNLFSETKQQSRNNKSVPSSYSAEALIGNQISTDSSSKRNISSHNKAIVPNFLSENLYFPAVDVSQDNGYMQTNQSFQTNSFSQNYTTTFQNNTYGPNNFIPSACTIPSTYIPNNNFMHNSNTQEFLGENSNIFQGNSVVQTKDKDSYIKNCYRQHNKDEKNESYCCKKVKKRSTNENTLPSFDIPFLSMPGNINSPILPDDFHTTYLPPTTLYSCKNPLYSKTNSEIPSTSLIPSLPTISGSKSGIQHPDLSLSVNSVGTSLTNFNLSTIFPEINKGPGQDTFPDTRNKDYHPVSKSFSMSSSLQVPFSTKSSIPFGSFGT